METKGLVTPENIVAGTMLAQLSVLAIMTLAALVIRRETSMFRWRHNLPSYTTLGWVILVLALLSLGALVLSNGFASTWRPLFRTLGYAGWSWTTAVAFAFALNIIALTMLVAETGGSIRSPFQPLYFLLPTLALFFTGEHRACNLLRRSIRCFIFVPPVLWALCECGRGRRSPQTRL